MTTLQFVLSMITIIAIVWFLFYKVSHWIIFSDIDRKMSTVKGQIMACGENPLPVRHELDKLDNDRHKYNQEQEKKRKELWNLYYAKFPAQRPENKNVCYDADQCFGVQCSTCKK